MFYIYFVCLLVFFCWLLTRIAWFSQTGIGAKLLVSLFLIRIIAALLGFYLSVYYYDYSDPLLFHRYGVEEYDLIFSNFPAYMTNLFTTDYAKGYAGFFDTTQSYWNNLGSNIVIKLLSLFNLISFKSFLINTLLYNFLIFLGPVALYKVFISLFPEAKIKIILTVFLFPSALLFTSIVHKDGLIFLSLSMAVYHLFFWMKEKRVRFRIGHRRPESGQPPHRPRAGTGVSVHPSQFESQPGKTHWRRLFIAILFLLLILFIRGYVFIVLLPSLVAWFLGSLKPAKSFPIFSVTYLLFITLFFLSPYISSRLNFPKYVSERQASFTEIADLGASTLPTDTLYPNFISFVKNAPQAFNHSFLRPYLFEGKWFYLPFSLETTAFILTLLLFIFFRKKTSIIPPIIYFLLFFSVTMFMVIGYTIPILGAIVRYRSVYFIFLVLPVLLYIDWARVRRSFKLSPKKA